MGETLHARRIALTTALGAMTLALTAPVFGGVAVAATERTVVTEFDITRQAENTPPTDNWVLYYRAAGNGAFRMGPAEPPLGAGSFEFTTPSDDDKATLFNYDHIGTRLADIDAMGYSTFRSAGRLQQLTSINIQVDYNGLTVAGGFTTLVFEPVYNTTQAAVTSGVWQGWDAYLGGEAIWWSTRSINGTVAFVEYDTWESIVAANPDATILGGYGLNQGSGSGEMIAANDALRLSHGSVDVTYDFEALPPTDKDQCKDGGYQKFSDPSFKNQGACVSYVQRGEKGSNGGGGDPSSVPAAKLAALSLLG